MLTKEEKISALQKVLNNIHLIGTPDPNKYYCLISGLCALTDYVLYNTYNERYFLINLIRDEMDKVGKNTINHFLWPRDEPEPRRQCLIEQIEKIQNNEQS